MSVEFTSGGQDVFVIDASALLRLFLADGPLPVGLEDDQLNFATLALEMTRS